MGSQGIVEDLTDVAKLRVSRACSRNPERFFGSARESGGPRDFGGFGVLDGQESGSNPGALYLLLGESISSRMQIIGLAVDGVGFFHGFLAIPRHSEADSESGSQGVIASTVLSDDARRLLQQRLPFRRFGARPKGQQ